MSKNYTRKITRHGITAYRINNNVSGGPRYVVHYLDIPYRDRREGEDYADYQTAHIEHAKEALGGNRYRGAWLSGGIVFVSFGIDLTLDEALGHSRREAFKASRACGDHEQNCDDPLNCGTLTKLIIERNLWKN